MIQRTTAIIEARQLEAEPGWQKILAEAVTDPRELLRRLQLSESLLPDMIGGHERFPIRVPEPYLQRIEPGNPTDPLLRQVLPIRAETHTRPGYVSDPLAEVGTNASAGQGVIRKYRSRALLVLSGACAINCRYCFRRHFPYAHQQIGRRHQDAAIATIAADPAINEVILSGGDPLTLSDRLLSELMPRLAALPQIRRLRIHSRLPVVIPQRVTDSLTRLLTDLPVPVVLVLHINHPREIDASVRERLQRLRGVGVTLFNQAVLLKGVNDHADTLESLSETLFEAGVLPYYLHGFDPVADAAHFDAGDEQLKALSRELLKRLPGFLVPRAVREVPGAESKWPLDLSLFQSAGVTDSSR